MTLAILVSPPGEEIDHHLNPTASSTREKGHLIFTTHFLTCMMKTSTLPLKLRARMVHMLLDWRSRVLAGLLVGTPVDALQQPRHLATAGVEPLIENTHGACCLG